MDRVTHLKDFRVIEFRRYLTVQGQRAGFAATFESYFPEAFQQVGALIHGHFFERRRPEVFTWIRGFHTLEDRATLNRDFYGGPLWREHRSTMNERLVDHTNTLLLEPLRPEREIVVLPAVDPVSEANGATGVVVAQIFAVVSGGVEALADRAEATFASYRAAGAREAGLLASLDVPNNFPALPYREDGPYLVWLGIVRDDEGLTGRLEPLAGHAARALAETGLLRGEPELVVLDPSPRSRLRWLPEATAWKTAST